MPDQYFTIPVMPDKNLGSQVERLCKILLKQDQVIHHLIDVVDVLCSQVDQLSASVRDLEVAVGEMDR